MNIINSTNYPLLEENIISAKGIVVKNDKGENFYDMEAGVWCLPLGHNHQVVKNAIHQQMEKVSHVGYLYSNSIVNKASDILIELTQLGPAKTVFLSSGSEAVEYALQLAKSIHPESQKGRVAGSYLSAYGAATGNQSDWVEINPTQENEINKDIMIFLFEPGNHSGTVKEYDKSFIQRQCDQVQKNGGIVIIDEVTCGFGRTGEWFGYMNYKINPDIVVCGKQIGNGYPVSAVVVKENIASLGHLKGFRYAQSHQNDPLGAAVIIAVANQIKEQNLVEKTKEKGVYLTQKINDLMKSNHLFKEIRSIGLMTVIEFTDKLSEEDMNKIRLDFHQKGFLLQVIPRYRLLRVYPPLIISYQELDLFLETLVNVLKTF